MLWGKRRLEFGRQSLPQPANEMRKNTCVNTYMQDNHIDLLFCETLSTTRENGALANLGSRLKF